jgi:hypothetical protein
MDPNSPKGKPNDPQWLNVVAPPGKTDVLDYGRAVLLRIRVVAGSRECLG